jgi:glycosyltransferase involved in cell wall biosynthesis
MLVALVRLPWGIANAFVRLTYDTGIAAQLQATLRSATPDIIIVTEPWLLAYAQTLRTCRATIVLDLHNIEQPLHSHVRTTAGGWKTKVRSWLLLRIAKVVEPTFVREADSIWVCSDHDATVLRDTYGAQKQVHVIPSCIDMDYYASGTVLADAMQNATPSMLFCANFGYGPNAEAAERLLHGILPHVLGTQPRCRLVLAGSNPTSSMRRHAARNSAIVVTGAVNDMRPYLQSQGAVYAVPLRHGSGTRLKILEAFAAGIPVVSTRKGAEGLNVHDGQELLLAETDAEFAQALALLWSDTEVRNRLCLSARRFLGRHASLAVAQESIVRACRFATASVSA